MHLLLTTFIFAISFTLTIAQMDTVYEWRYIDYLWNNKSAKIEAIENGNYDFRAVIPMDVDKSTDGRVFLTFMGWKNVPATLGVVSNEMGPSGPLISPYPDWSYYQPKTCESILNVYRIAIDECNRLWVLDNGYIEDKDPLAPTPCPAKLLVFDLFTNTLLKKILIPDEIARNSSRRAMLTNTIVETEGRCCENTTVYMAESIGSAIIVWDGVKLSRIENPSFQSVNEATKVSDGLNEVNYSVSIVGMDVSPRMFPEEPRFLYYRPLTSFDLYRVPARAIKKGDLSKVFGKKKLLCSQALGQAFSAEGTLFMGMTKEAGITCWNRYTDMIPENVELVAQNIKKLRYPNGVKVIPPYGIREEELLVLSNRLIEYDLKKLDYNESNFHVLSSPVKRLIQNTKCDSPFRRFKPRMEYD